MSEQEIKIEENITETAENHKAVEGEEHGEGHGSIHTPPIKPEVLFNIGPVPVSNAMFASVIVTIIIFSFIYFIKRQIKIVPTKMQIVAEGLVNMFYEKFLSVYENNADLAKKHTAIIVSFFIFIFVTNLLPMMPIISSLKWNHAIHIARPATSHYAFTLALGTMSLFTAHLLGFMHHGFGHIGKFFRFGEFLKIRKFMDVPTAIIEFGIGILEAFGELSKIISLASRLFGNIFAHEIIVAVISGISVFTQFLAPVPFYILGFLVAFIQATVFSLLSMTILVSHVKGH